MEQQSNERKTEGGAEGTKNNNSLLDSVSRYLLK
jgi:hypothetical protein